MHVMAEGVGQSVAMSIPPHAGAEDICGVIDEGVLNFENQSSKQELELVGDGNVSNSNEGSQRMMVEGAGKSVAISIRPHVAEDMCGVINEGVLNFETQSSKELVGDGNVSNSNEESQRMMVEGAGQSVAISIPPHAGAEDMCVVINEWVLNLETQNSKQALELVGDGNVSNSNEESRRRRTQEKDTDNLGFRARCVPVLRILSAALYLFDVVSTLLVLKEYYKMDTLFSPAKHPSVLNNNFGGFALGGVFITFLIMLVVAHVANAIAFMLILPHEEQPIMSAYFLPLIQLRRLLSDLWAAGTCHRSLQISESDEAEALYAIMACAVETGPQLVLQIGILQCTYVHNYKRSPIIFWSIAASFLSGAFNGGRAVMYISNQKSKIRSYACGVLGGLYSFAALLSKCSIISIMIVIGYGWGQTGPEVLYFILDNVSMMVMIFLRARPKMRESLEVRKVYRYGVRVCYAIVFGYVSSYVGPLYTIVSDARARRQFKERKFLIWLLVTSFMHLIIDGIGWTLIITFYRNNQTSCSHWGTVTCVSFRVGVYTGIFFSSVSIVSYSWLLSLDKLPLEDT